MKEIVKVLLQEGIDEETIHEVLYVLESSPRYYPYDVEKGDAASHKSVERHAAKKAKQITGEIKRTEKEHAKASNEAREANKKFENAKSMYKKIRKKEFISKFPGEGTALYDNVHQKHVNAMNANQGKENIEKALIDLTDAKGKMESQQKLARQNKNKALFKRDTK